MQKSKAEKGAKLSILPSVAIGLPVYNGERYIAQSIESVLNQHFTDFTFLISDNASTDATWEICQSYAARDRRIRLRKNSTNTGALENFNLVLQETESDFFMWHAHDDLLGPSYVGNCYKFLKENEAFVLCCSRTTFINDTGQETYSDVSDYNLDSNDAIERYRKCFEESWLINLAFYGLIRRNFLKKLNFGLKTQGKDFIDTLQLSLMGKFHQSSTVERYYRRRKYESAREAVEWYSKQLQGDNFHVTLFPHFRMLSNVFKMIAGCDLDKELKLGLVTATLKNVKALKLWSRYDVLHLAAFCSYRSRLMYNILTKLYAYLGSKGQIYPRI